jgi:hypothetical protein
MMSLSRGEGMCRYRAARDGGLTVPLTRDLVIGEQAAAVGSKASYPWMSVIERDRRELLGGRSGGGLEIGESPSGGVAVGVDVGGFLPICAGSVGIACFERALG